MKRVSFLRKALAIVVSGVVAFNVAFLGWTGVASADVTVAKTEAGWEVFTAGRLNAFLSWAKGDNTPVAPLVNGTPAYQFKGAGGTGVADTDGIADPVVDPVTGNVVSRTQGTVDSMRLRSGFVGNVLTVGVRRDVTPYTKFTGVFSLWSIVESPGRRKYFPNYVDMREGFLKFEGPWGSFLAGKALTLYNRGATEANFMYLHGFGLGFPGSISGSGPAAGMIGFGILASTFSGGMVYATPKLFGVQLSAGIYDPASLVGSRLERTGLVRPEFELTVDEPIGTLGKVHLYFNGTTQKLYARQEPNSTEQTAQGIGYGGRVEVGPVHVAAGGHRGKGLGLTFALEPSESTYDGQSRLRDSEGYYAMGQVSLKKFDVNFGYGQTKVKPLPTDLDVNPMTMFPTYSLIYTQTGIAGALVYHHTDWIHFTLDVMHADFKWTAGDRQQINFFNAGTTVTW